MKRNEMKLPQVIPPSAGNQNKSTDALDFTSVYQLSSFSIGLHWTFGGTYNNFVNSSVRCITWHLLSTLRFFTRSISSISHIWPHCFISRFIFIRWCWFFFSSHFMHIFPRSIHKNKYTTFDGCLLFFPSCVFDSMQFFLKQFIFWHDMLFSLAIKMLLLCFARHKLMHT